VKVEQVRPSVLRITLHVYEMAPLVAAARWVAENAKEEMPAESLEQLHLVLDRYDEAMGNIEIPD
jgi:hypothetical protein